MEGLFNKYWLDNFDCHPAYEFIQRTLHIPVLCVIGYVMIVFLLPRFINQKCNLRHSFAMWNFVLSIFSTCGFWACVPFVYRGLTQKGLHYMVCSDDMMFGGHKFTPDAACYRAIGFFMTAFMFSKVPELLDTVFLILERKPVIFLHWWHHLSVLLCSWYAYATATPTAVIFGTVNYGVHSVMYFYFGASQYTKAFSFMRQPITSLQLLQMALGLFLTCTAGYYQYHGQCTEIYVKTHYYEWNFVMYGSYFILFAKLYVDNYIRSSKKPSKKVQ